MKHTLRNLLAVTSLGILSTGYALAEGDGNKNWAEEAAQKYERLAFEAVVNDQPDKAAIYKRMAQIKRDAGAAKGEFSWDEYHELEGKLNQLKQGSKKGKAHNGFLETAKKYDQKADAASAAGNDRDAKIYRKLAEIKRKAAEGKLDNWDEYHALSAKLSGKKAKKHDHKKKHSPKEGANKKGAAKSNKSASQSFLKTADEYQAKANKAMNEGNEHNAAIYTRLANIKREAAVAVEAGNGYDWTEYFKLKKQLK